LHHHRPIANHVQINFPKQISVEKLTVYLPVRCGSEKYNVSYSWCARRHSARSFSWRRMIIPIRVQQVTPREFRRSQSPTTERTTDGLCAGTAWAPTIFEEIVPMNRKMTNSAEGMT
jgi:hypothetical protein